MITSFSDAVDACGGASEIARTFGIRVSTAQKWKDRDNIPPEYWRRVIDMAWANSRRKITIDRFVRIAEKRAPTLLVGQWKKDGEKPRVVIGNGGKAERASP